MKHEVCGFEHLHRHSDFSLLDGFATVEEYGQYSKEVNQKFLCITDHGVMGSVPQQIRVAEEYGLEPIFGIEMYICPLQFESKNREENKTFFASLSEEDKPKFSKSNHILAIASNETGYKNLVRLSSWGWIHGFYRRPRINHDVLQKYKEGVIFTSGCANSEIAQAFLRNYNDEEGFAMLEKYLEMLGRDNFYLELMMLDFKLQKPYDSFLIRAHRKYNLPFIISQDCLVETSLILTQNGHKQICDINPGDKVLTHNDRWKEVEAVGKRRLKNGEKVYRISTSIDKNALEATEDHKVFIGKFFNEIWSFETKKCKDISVEDDYLLIPKIKQSSILSKVPLDKIDLLDYISDFQIHTNYVSSPKGNMGCKLQYSKKEKQFTSYRGWNRKNPTIIPRYIKVDKEFLNMIGWYIAEGWSEKKSNQVGFAFHIDEKPEADRIVKYFEKFNITPKIYKVSENGIAIRFSSIVFNNFLGKLCGYGAKNKHLPYIDGTWIKKWSLEQLRIILKCYWMGDGSYNTSGGFNFASTSKILISELRQFFLSLGIVCGQSSEKKNKKWNKTYKFSCTGSRGRNVGRFFENQEIQDNYYSRIIELPFYYACKIKEIQEIEYESFVYDIQVQDDHTFLSNLYRIENCHYCRKEHSFNQQLMLMMQNQRTLQEIEILKQTQTDLFELQDQNLWMKSEWELDEMWEREYQDIIDYEIYKEAKRNTVRICNQAKGVKLDRSVKLPKIPDATEKLKEAIAIGMKKRNISTSNVKYIKRIKEEYDLICKKEFASYFLIQKYIVDEARRICPKLLGWGDGSEALGCGRGSAPGALVCYLLGITDIDPIKHDLLFSRFLSPSRGGKSIKYKYNCNLVPA